jgi:hypothetical protein
MIFRPWRKAAVGNIRDNSAARVAGPGRICFYRGWKLLYVPFHKVVCTSAETSLIVPGFGY